MARKLNTLRETPGHRISEVIKFLVHYRGIEAEHALISAFGQDRILEVYAGDEPRFSELEEIASIMSVPISTFQIVSPGDFSELEIVWAEILYTAKLMNRREREKLSLTLLEVIRTDDEVGANLLDQLRQRTEKS